jgi:hypothetical protein
MVTDLRVSERRPDGQPVQPGKVTQKLQIADAVVVVLADEQHDIGPSIAEASGARITNHSGDSNTTTPATAFPAANARPAQPANHRTTPLLTAASDEPTMAEQS